MSDFYWELITRDETRLEIPPDAVETVKRRMQNREPINTQNMAIPADQIRTFRKTDKPFVDQPLLEGVAQAFHEPLVDDQGDMVARWVKKTVPQDRWNKYYSKHPYRMLAESGGMVDIAFKLPVHSVDQTKVSYCSEQEIERILKRY